MRFLLRPFLGTLILLGSLVCSPIASFAAPISGVLNITGSVRVNTDPALGGVLDFLPTATGVGDFHADAFTQSGTFTSVANTNGSIMDLNQTAQPVGVDFVLDNFLTFAAAPNLSLTLTHIVPGSFPSADCAAAPAAGQTCTIPPNAFGQSQFNLSNTSTGSVVSFSILGLVQDSDTGEWAPFNGTFSTQFTGVPYQQLLSTINAGGSLQATYSATINVVPEPAPITLLLSGGLLLGAGLARRHRLAARK